MKPKHQITSNHRPGGLLGWFAANHVAANLLMVFVLFSGVMSMMFITIEIFPEISINIIRVSVPYLGASPSEAEEGVCLRVEEAISSVDGVKRVLSTASEGMGTIVAEVEDYADIKEVLDDIKAEVDRIETFPQETEKPIITKIDNRIQVITVSIYGEASERTLKNLADQVRDDLTAMEGISLVEMAGVRRYEISIEISDEMLRRYHLSFDQIARIVNNSSLDLPGGSVKTRGGEILVRTKGQKYSGSEFENIIVLTRSDGTQLRLGEMATVIDGFEDSDLGANFNGKPAAMLNVYRIGQQDALEITDRVKQYVKETGPTLPAGVQMDVWSDFSQHLRSRMDLLTRNGYIGITLVFLCLTFFLDLKLAFWTTLGIPISFLGAFMLLPVFGVSINMISLFAFIVVLGIVVDDAIVVGENIFSYRQQGMDPLEAAVTGAKEMAAPVTMAILTTIAAFLPLLMLEGIMGKFIRVIPIVVISVLSFSLIEAFLILPAHLSVGKTRRANGPIARIQKRIRNGLEKFIHGPFARQVARATRYRYITLALGFAIFLATIGYIVGGHIRVVFFDEIEADNIFATLTMPQGTTRSETEKILQIIEESAEQMQQEILDQGQSEQPVIKNMATIIGSQPFSRDSGGPHGRGVTSASGAHLAEINLELINAKEREVSTKIMANRWRDIIGELSGISSLTFTSSIFTTGDAINVELSHRDFDTLVSVADHLKEKLAEYNGVSEIADSFEPGKIELKLALTDQGRTLGLTLADLARQVRQGFYGQEVQRIQRGRDDIRVMLRYPKEQRYHISDIHNMRIRLESGTEVAFSQVAQVRQGRGYTTINRADRRRIVSVTADVDETLNSANDINQELRTQILPSLRLDYPGLTFAFEGEQRQRAESMGSLKRDFIIALLAIYALLAVQFRSYVQPLIIMSAIPFGLIGAVIGHVIMGYNLTFLSMFGIVALTGVVVNDSLILIDLINRRSHEETATSEIVLTSTLRRFRPIILTTLTTFFGLMPIILEKSLQAKILIPMAVSLGFGVLFATVITLLMVPALYLILEDVKNLFAKSNTK